MRKALIIILTILMLFTALAGGIDNAYESGSISFAPISLIPKEYQGAQIVSISPAGTGMLASLGIVNAVSNGASVFPIAEAAGDSDAVRFINKLITSRAFDNRLNYAWSKSGRYVCIYSRVYSYVNMQLISPFIVDTMTGTVTVIKEYPTKLPKGGATVTGAFFSDDDSCLYYTVYGAAYEKRNALIRYDLATKEESIIFAGNGGSWMESLQLSNGKFLINNEPSSTKEFPRTYMISSSGYGISFRISKLPAVNRRFLPVRRMEYSPISGAVVTMANNSAELKNALVISYPEKSLADSIHIVFLPDGTPEIIHSLNSCVDGRYAYIYDYALSPDGGYVLIRLVYEGSQSCYMLRLNDLTTVPVTGLDDVVISSMPSVSGQFASGFEWTDTALLMYLEPGLANTYTIR